MKIRSVLVAGVAAGALSAPVAAPAVPSIPIPASGPSAGLAGAEVVQVAGKKAKAKKKAKREARTQRKAAKKAARKAGGGRKALKAAGGKPKARKAGKKRLAEARGAAAKAKRHAAREWRQDQRKARRKALRRDDPRQLYRFGNRDDPRAWREAARDDRWERDRRDEDRWPRARRDDDRWARARRDDDRYEARREERRRWVGWQRDRDYVRHARYGWQADRWRDRDDDAWRRDRAFLLFAPARDTRRVGWTEPRRVRVLSGDGVRWVRPAAAAPVFGWQPNPVASLFGLGAARSYGGWDRGARVVRGVDAYPTRVYRTGYASPYSNGYRAWRPSAFDVGYGSFGSGSLFGDLSGPLTALLLAAYL